jgi:Fe-S oxidoreductase
MLNAIIFIIFLVIAFGIFIFSMKKYLFFLKIGKPENRTNNITQRIKNTLTIAIFQSKLFRSKLAGTLHSTIFWGFCILLFVVLENIIEGFIPGFTFAFLGKFYSSITVTEDIFGTLVFFAVIFSLFRRYIRTPKRLQVEMHSRLDATLILLMILFIMITMFGVNIEKILLGTNNGYRPFSEFLAELFDSHGSSSLCLFFWWAHIITILTFLNYLPYSKHFHVLLSIPNTFLSNYKIENKNLLKPINFKDESIQQYGVKDIEDLSWKQLLDGFTCTECGRCTEVCPASETGKLLNPKIIVTQIRKRTREKGNLIYKEIKSGEVLDKYLINDYISPEELWACTTCTACVEECPVMIDHITSIVDMRRDLVMMESAFPQELNAVFKNLENNESPWAFGSEARNEWIEEFTEESSKNDLPNTMTKLSNSCSADSLDIVFWVGCIGAFDKRYRNVTKSFAKIMSIAGVKFGVLGNEEKCNGDTARRLGSEFLAQQLIQKNLETFRRYNIKKIVTTCPHCLHSLKNEYPQFGIELEVIHHSEFIDNLIKEKKIAPRNSISETLTYHDPCYLGRYNEVYYSPRNIIKSIPQANLIEMKRSLDKGFCCGAGGGRMFMEEKEGKRVNIERIEEAIITEATTVCSACPFCMTMLSDGVKAKEKEEKIKVKDIAELIYDSL